LCLTTGPAPKCHFVLGLSSESLEIPKVGTPVTLGAHNFVCRPSIEVRSKEKISLVESFPKVCGTPPARKEIGAIFE